jgi:isopentenyldiphosphate isomerase
MAAEYFDIYNENMNFIGTELRTEVHKKGYWHKSFQCWFIFKNSGKDYILFQRRHTLKDTYPGLLDISSAGHLSSGEELRDGVRELEEELGISVRFDELISLGIIIERKQEINFIDNEFANVFLYNCKIPMENFKFQIEEVTGIFKILIDDIIELFEGRVKFIEAQGYELDESGKNKPLDLYVTVKDFVPHALDYYRNIFNEAKFYLQ